jgi:hypothetical protein
MVDLEIQAQVGSVSSKHLEDFSTSLRTGSHLKDASRLVFNIQSQHLFSEQAIPTSNFK